MNGSIIAHVETINNNELLVAGTVFPGVSDFFNCYITTVENKIAAVILRDCETLFQMRSDQRDIEIDEIVYTKMGLVVFAGFAQGTTSYSLPGSTVEFLSPFDNKIPFVASLNSGTQARPSS